MARVQQRRGLRANLPATALLAGELLVTTDQQTAHVAVDATTLKPLVPAVDALATLATVDGTADFIALWDASEASESPYKKMTFSAFKSALAIPPGSSDEKVAVVSGGTPGFVWGTDGTDGILRMGPSMSWVKDSGNAFVTLAVNIVDCGTF